MKRNLVLLPLLVGGCWVTTEQVATKVADVPSTTPSTEIPSETQTDLGPLSLDSVEPAVGSNAGGFEVVITVGPLDPDDVSVTFAGVVATVLSASSDNVLVRTPAVAGSGMSAVVVTSRGETISNERAFYYWADGGGRAGLLGVVSNHDFDRAYYAPPHHERSASLGWVEPIAFRWWELYAPTIDTCVRDYELGSPRPVFLAPEVSEIELSGSSGEYALEPDSSGQFYSMSFEEGSFTKGSAYDLSQPQGRDGFPPLFLQDVIDMPAAGLRVTSPITQETQAVLPPFASVNVVWSGGEPGDYVLLRVRRRAPSGSTSVVVDDITCAVRDDGNHLVSNDHWTGWDPGSGIELSVGRAIEGQGTLPTNGAQARVYGIQWWHGRLIQGS